MPDNTPQAGVNWNLLRNFCVIAQQKSITRAARKLGISQPSASLSLKKLEEQLGCKLVFRGARHFSLTLRGEKIFHECAEMIACADRIAQLAKDDGDDGFGELVIHSVSGLNSQLFDEALRLFHRRHPSITWRIEVRNSRDIVQKIATEKTGLGVCLLTKPMPMLDCRKLFREDFGIYCGKEHHLFGQTGVELRVLQREAFVSFECASDGIGLEPMVLVREGAGLGRRISGSSSSLEEVRRMLICGLGIGILPEITAAADVAEGRLWPLALRDHPLGADVYLVAPPHSHLTPPEASFLDLVEELRGLYPDMS